MNIPRLPAADEEAPVPSSRELLRRAYDILASQGTPLATATLAQHIFGSVPSGAGTSSWGLLAKQLLGSSSQFVADENGDWGLSSWVGAERPLDEVEFAVVDVETTGLAPGHHRVIEVGAVIVKTGRAGSQLFQAHQSGPFYPPVHLHIYRYKPPHGRTGSYRGASPAAPL